MGCQSAAIHRVLPPVCARKVGGKVIGVIVSVVYERMRSVIDNFVVIIIIYITIPLLNTTINSIIIISYIYIAIFSLFLI